MNCERTQDIITKTFRSPLFFRSSPGFTLIEILIVIGIVGVISSMGFVSLRDYSEKQLLSETVNDFASAVQLARSRAQTQVKPQASARCRTNPLNGYQVEVRPSGSNETVYEVRPVCGSRDTPVLSKTVPREITVQSSLSPILFQTLTGNVVMPGSSVTVSFQGTKGQGVVTIYANGRIVKSP